MKTHLLKIGIVIFSLSIVFSCKQNENEKYIFFLHSRFLEGQIVEKWHPDYGRIESYYEVLKKYQKAGFKVISEQRIANINAREYAVNIVRQIDSLLNNGVNAESITIIGTSKGGYIAQYVSTIAANPDLNFVFIASFVDNDIENIPGINYCGNILTIYEKSDPFGVSALERFNTSNCDIKHFQEIELNTGLQHGFIFEPLEAWINPCIQWANRNYEAFEVNDVIYKSSTLEIMKLDDDLFVHKSYLKKYNNFPCNGMVYVNNGEAIVFDTPTDDSTSIELINWIKNDLDCNIKAIVINHFHIDCLGGLNEFHKNGIPSYASHLTIELANSDNAHNDIVPEIGFSDTLRIDVGDSYVENRYFGAGHSPDNIVSYIQDKKALFGGCLIKADKANKGSLTDANVKEWSNTVQKVKNHYSNALDFVVPGHGNPGGIELLDYTIQLFEQK